MHVNESQDVGEYFMVKVFHSWNVYFLQITLPTITATKTTTITKPYDERMLEKQLQHKNNKINAAENRRNSSNLKKKNRTISNLMNNFQ